MKTRILFLWALLLMGAANSSAQIKGGTCGENLTWTLFDGTLTISGTGAMPDYSSSGYAPWYPDRYSITTITIGNEVTNIGNYAFADCYGLTSATIPDRVTSIGDGAFSSCYNLTSVIIPDRVTNIGNDAFFCCFGITSVTIGNNVTSIGNYAFFDCDNLTSVTIPDRVTSIGYAAFAGCNSLTSITIGSNVRSIGSAVFAGCNLMAIYVEDGNEYFSSEDGVLFNKDKTVLLCCPGGKSGNYTIPNSVTSIIDYAFYNCSDLTSVTIPDRVTSIEYRVFDGCRNLTSVTNLNPTPQNITSTVFDYVDLSNATLYVPAETVETYKATNIWKKFGTITAYIPSAIHTPEAENIIRIYPNPVTESFHVGGITAPAQVVVTDISGKAVLQQTVKGEESISVGHLPQGVYLVRVNGKTIKVIKR